MRFSIGGFRFSTGGGRADSLAGDDRDDLILGLGGADTLDGGGGSDTILGGQGADLLRGGDGDDVVSGGRGADTLLGGAGDDLLQGGRGLDEAAFAGPRARYAITLAEDGTATVRDHAAAGDGTDRLDGVELLRFADGTLDLRDLPEANAVVLAQIADGQGAGFVMRGVAAPQGAFNVNVGQRTAGPAGDVNGDGLPDLLLTGADGAAHVVFGKADTTPVDLADVAEGLGGGFRVGGSGGAFAVPDLNGDGRAEILANGGPEGPVLVFGKADAAPVDLAAVAAGEGGFAIRGEAGRLAPVAAGVMPDVNGDGLPELLLTGAGRPAFTPEGGTVPPEAPHAYLVFGTAEGPVALDGLVAEARGMLFSGSLNYPPYLESGIAITPLADLDGDGRADLLLRDQSPVPGGSWGQRNTVVFTPPAAEEVRVDAAALGSGGFLLAVIGASGSAVDNRSVLALPDPADGGPGGLALVSGPQRFEVPGPQGETRTLGGDLPASGGPRSLEWRGATGVVPVPDLDGDGRPELLLGGYTTGEAPGAPVPVQTGRAGYLVLSAGGEAAITGANSRPAGSVSDLDGDGLPELLLVGQGGGFVLFGSAAGTPIDLAATAAQGLGGVAIQGDVAGLRAMPDLTGDGRPELLAQSADGTAYVVFNDPLWLA
jgi:hypothetical protein